jgi:hypothetical protein
MSGAFAFACITAFDRGLSGLAQVLKRAEASGKGGIMDARLSPDMYPLSRQISVACDFARNAPARVLGLAAAPEAPVSTFADAQKLIVETRAFLQGLDASKFEGLEVKPVTYPIGDQERTSPAIQYLMGFAAPNFNFHSVAAYMIVRNQGVALTKRDFFGIPG